MPSVYSLYILCVSYFPLMIVSGHGDEHREMKLLIVSFDGFRWDYLNNRTKTEYFNIFKNKGVAARNGLKNAFLTKTFPNHFTLVTGMWEESHGIVGNTMYDPTLNETFTASNKTQESDPRWWDAGGEPIWVTHQLQNPRARSGCIMWAGCQAPIKGVTPTRHIPFNRAMNISSRIDLMVEWFKDKYPINLGLLYYEQPDECGHQYGPDSPNVTAMIKELDDVVGYLLSKLDKANLLEDMNIIITSDHGFSATSSELVINLDDYVSPKSYRIFSSSPVAAILPLNDGETNSIYENLTKGSESGNFSVYLRARHEIPSNFHFTNNVRIMPIIVVARENFTIVYNNSKSGEKGTHGYNNSLPDMHPFFLAMGPSFRTGMVVDTFDSVDVYALMCHLLNLIPAPNNGSLAAVEILLKVKEEDTVTTFGTYFFVLIVIASIGGVFSVAACRQHRYLKRLQRTRIINMEGGVKYSTPPNNGGKVPLLLESDNEDSFQ